MRDVGAIVRLQIQRSSLKTGEKPHRRYDPAPLLSVERLAVAPRRLGYDELAGGIAVVDRDGRELVRLQVLQVAHPCRPFTGWALGGTVEAQVLKEHLQFLDGGTRGYYCRGVGTGIVSIGDRVALL